VAQINRSRLFEAFREDHALLGQGLHRLRERLTARDAAGVRAAAEHLDRQAGAHIAFEEADFYPALEAFLSHREVDAMYREHAQGLALLVELMRVAEADLQIDDRVQRFLRRLDAMAAHVAECGDLFGAMGGLADADIDRLLSRLEHWRGVAPRWSERPEVQR